MMESESPRVEPRRYALLRLMVSMLAGMGLGLLLCIALWGGDVSGGPTGRQERCLGDVLLAGQTLVHGAATGQGHTLTRMMYRVTITPVQDVDTVLAKTLRMRSVHR